ncbi:MAG: O-antigen ligase family protein [Actinobacteria bacterium]|nr:MAG: O-antigen ligase family protein [Actinomycetota bacterium]
MPHGDLAQLSAALGGLGAAAMLLSRSRAQVLAGLGLTAIAEGGLAAALIPGRDLKLLVSPPLHLVALVLGLLLVSAGAAAFVRYPVVVPIALLAAAPFRISVSIGAQKAYLLLPLYVVLAAAMLGLIVRALRGPEARQLPPLLAVPAAAFVLLAGVSLTWTRDLRQGTIELLFFLFPFSALVIAVVWTPFRPWHPRALAATLVALAGLFSAVALFQRLTHGHLLAGDVERANAYTTYFRVTSLFKDPSIFGRHVVIAIAVLLVAVWLGRIGFWVGTALIAFLWAGLFFSYSQSSFVALFAVGVAISYALGGTALRRVLMVGAAVCVLAGAAFVAATAVNDSARQATSGRTRLARVTWVVFTNHPLVGVGIGGQPQASRDEAKTKLSAKRDRSHTTPLTVAAELGLVGLVVYLALLAGATRLLFLLTRVNRALGLGAAAVFLTLLVHSLFYAGFFEDPIVWGVIALAAWALLAAPQRSPAPRDTQVVEPATRDRRPERTPAELQHQAPLAD